MTITTTPDNLERSCREKHRYATKEIADAVAARCFDKRGEWLRVYLCDDPRCGGYHLTKTHAEPREGWRPPAKSARQLALEGRANGRNRRRRR